MIVYREIYIFTSPRCLHCKQLEATLKTERGIKVPYRLISLDDNIQIEKLALYEQYVEEGTIKVPILIDYRKETEEVVKGKDNILSYLKNYK